MKNPTGIIQWSSRFVRCSDCGLKKRCLPKNLSEQEITALEAIVAARHSYRRGEYLYHFGDCLTDLTIIKSGSAKTELISETGEGQIVGFHFPGDLLGIDSLNSNPARSSVVFLKDSTVCTIPWLSFKSLSTQAPQLQLSIMTRLSSELSGSHELMLARNHYSAEQRMACSCWTWLLASVSADYPMSS